MCISREGLRRVTMMRKLNHGKKWDDDSLFGVQ